MNEHEPRINALLARYGIESGSSRRERRQALANRLSVDCPHEVTEEAMEALKGEAELRGIANRAAWMADQLDDTRHVGKMLVEIVEDRRRAAAAKAKAKAGEVSRPARSAAEAEARWRNMTPEQVEAEACDARVYGGLVYDRAPPARIARELGCSVDEVLAMAARHVERHPDYVPWQQAIDSGARPSIRFGRAREKALASAKGAAGDVGPIFGESEPTT